MDYLELLSSYIYFPNQWLIFDQLSTVLQYLHLALLSIYVCLSWHIYHWLKYKIVYFRLLLVYLLIVVVFHYYCYFCVHLLRWHLTWFGISLLLFPIMYLICFFCCIYFVGLYDKEAYQAHPILHNVYTFKVNLSCNDD